MIGGFYLKGKEFDITEPQIEQELQFNMKFVESNITMTKEDVQVLNKGKNAAFRLIDSRTRAAYTSMGAQIELAMYLNGIRANYTPLFNGLAEAVNDGTTVSWDNNAYTQYGTITRGGAVGTTLNSTPIDVNGSIEYTGTNGLEQTYMSASYGPGEWSPNLGVTTQIGYSLVKEKFQTQQRFNDTQDPKIGFEMSPSRTYLN
jgi:type II secretory pathway pseudopilin PulG